MSRQHSFRKKLLVLSLVLTWRSVDCLSAVAQTPTSPPAEKSEEVREKKKPDEARLYLRQDDRLFATVSVVGIDPTREQIFRKLEAATGLKFSVSPELQNLHHQYGTFELDDVNACVVMELLEGYEAKGSRWVKIGETGYQLTGPQGLAALQESPKSGAPGPPKSAAPGPRSEETISEKTPAKIQAKTEDGHAEQRQGTSAQNVEGDAAASSFSAASSFNPWLIAGIAVAIMFVLFAAFIGRSRVLGRKGPD